MQTQILTPRERFIKALRREEIEGLVPHFELVFYLTMEALGKPHPTQLVFDQWDQMSRTEQRLHIQSMARTYVDTADKFEHSAILVHPNPSPHGRFHGRMDTTVELLETIRELCGDRYFLMLQADPTLSIPSGDTMMEMAVQMYERPEEIHERTRRNVDYTIWFCGKLRERSGLLDGWAMCSDYCLNANPFFTRDQFSTFIQPYLTETIDYYRQCGYYSIKHTDGNIMPILDLLIACGPDALHSLDPQGGVDMAEVKRRYGHRVCLIGNVNCGLMQTGTEEELTKDVIRSLNQGMPGYGYVFSTSNCVYTGLQLSRYQLMQDVWRQYGVYPTLRQTGDKK